MSKIPTIRVKHPDIRGGVLINQADFDPERHQPYDEPAAEPAPATPTTSAPPKPRRPRRAKT